MGLPYMPISWGGFGGLFGASPIWQSQTGRVWIYRVDVLSSVLRQLIFSAAGDLPSGLAQ